MTESQPNAPRPDASRPDASSPDRGPRPDASSQHRGPRPDRGHADFLPGALAVTERPPHPLPRVLGLSLAALALAGLAWSSLGAMDVVASAQGKVIPAGRVKPVQAAEAGVVAEIHVREGQTVAAGAPLVTFDQTGIEADRATLLRELGAARLERAKHAALAERPDAPLAAFVAPPDLAAELVDAHRLALASRAAEFAAKRAKLAADLAKREAEAATLAAEAVKLDRTLPLLERRVAARQALVAKEIAAEMSLLELRQAQYEAQGEREVKRARAREAIAGIAAAEREIATLEAERAREVAHGLVEAERRVAALEQDLVKLERRRTLSVVTAPEAGVAQLLSVRAPGEVATLGQTLMAIVPSGAPLEVEAMMPNKDIGFVRAGQPCQVKLETFLFTRYGSIGCEIRAVSADAVDDPRQGPVYPVRARLDAESLMVDGRPTRLAPGMAATVEVRIGERRLISYLLSPLQRNLAEAARER